MLSPALHVVILLWLLPCNHLSRPNPGSSHVGNKSHPRLHVHNETDVDNMSDKEVQYNFFMHHDINNDNRLDGLEIIYAILHYQEGDESLSKSAFSDKELIWFLDVIFGRDDRNDDGFLDLSEFMDYKSIN